MNAVRFTLRWWTAFGLLAALAMLATAHAFQHFGGLAPCHLCLKQRDVYWFAVAIAAPATVWSLFTASKGTPRVAAYCLFAIFATGAIVATYHAGAELKWWKGPESCTGGGEMSIDSMALQAILRGAPVKVPQCDVVVWQFLGLSMAGWNAIVSAVLAVISLVASMRSKDVKFAK